jgi:hypothetical protein
MKRTLSFVLMLLLVDAFTLHAETSGRVGTIAVTAGLNGGKNDGDAIAQLSLGLEYGLLRRISLGAGYVYVDGIHPFQEHALDLSLKGYLFDRLLDMYGDVGTQISFSDGITAFYTLKSGLEWRSSFGLLIAAEGGAELEASEWGYLFGLRFGWVFDP